MNKTYLETAPGGRAVEADSLEAPEDGEAAHEDEAEVRHAFWRERSKTALETLSGAFWGGAPRLK